MSGATATSHDERRPSRDLHAVSQHVPFPLRALGKRPSAKFTRKTLLSVDSSPVVRKSQEIYEEKAGVITCELEGQKRRQRSLGASSHFQIPYSFSCWPFTKGLFLETLENCSHTLGTPTSVHLPTVSPITRVCLKNPFCSLQWCLSVFFYHTSPSCGAVLVPHSLAPIHFLFNTVFLHSLTRT